MRILLGLILSLISIVVLAEAPPLISSFDAKIYSLKNKGVKDFTVDIASSKLTKQINEQMIFGKIKKVVFRIFWTANPERLDIEVLGLPEGFKEIKEELKVTIRGILDGLLPPITTQRFVGYRLTPTSNPKEVLASDTTGLALIPSYVLQFDDQDRLSNVIARKHIGVMSSKSFYDKTGFSDGKWVLNKIMTSNEENGQIIEVEKKYAYGSVQGIGVLKKIIIKTDQRKIASNQKALSDEEEVEFETYKINTGDALKHFLGIEGKP